MIFNNNSKGFLEKQWQWIVLGAAVLLLAFSVFLIVSALGKGDSADAGVHASGKISRSSGTGVKAVDMTPFDVAKKSVASPTYIIEPSETQGSYLATPRRVYCEKGDEASKKKACALPIPFGSKECPLCGMKQPVEIKVVLDGDKDGIPDEFEKKNAMNPKNPSDINDDNDNDGFTNMEEYVAKTDLNNSESHPDYLGFLKVVPPLKHTMLSFVFERAMKMPDGTTRFFFRDPTKVNDYGQRGVTYSVRTGEKIGATGFVAKHYNEKTEKVKIQGSNVSKERDVSEAVVERASDGKRLTLKIHDRKRLAVDMKVTLHYDRTNKDFVLAIGDAFALNKGNYKVRNISKVGKRILVVIENVKNGEERTIEGLE
jgi:hypothetical protein